MRYYLFNHGKGRRFYLLVGDSVVLFIAVAVSYALRILINSGWRPDLFFGKMTPWLFLVVLPNLFSLYLLGQYNLNRVVNRFRSSVLVILSVLLAGLMTGSIFFFFSRYIFGRQVFLIHLVVASTLLVCWRILFHESISGRACPRKMGVIGKSKTVLSYVDEIRKITGDDIVLESVCFTDDQGHPDIPGVRFYHDIVELLDSNSFDILVFEPLERSFTPREIQSIIEKKYRGKIVFDLPSLYKNLSGKIPLQYIDGNWLLQQEGLQGYVSRQYVYVKRFLDFTLATILLLILAPVGLLIMSAIKLDSRGPVIFSQERIGLHRAPFRCLKFRTMIEDAEKTSGPVWSSDEDPRITRVGRLLRKSRMDEIPQLWNILRGELSFVGPRPIRQHFADLLSRKIPFYDIRFSVQPGLSGWAQVNLDYAGSEEGQKEKFEYELFYIQNMSFFLDVLTIIKTVRSVFRGEGR